VTLDTAVYERILRGEITLRGTWGFAFTRFPHHPWQEAAHALAAGLVKTGPLVTHRVPLEELPDAIGRMSLADPSIHKILVVP
jgi:L-iditol 2-dehydrogenase